MTVITNMQRLYPDTDTGLCKWGIALAMPQVRCPAFAPPSFNSTDALSDRAVCALKDVNAILPTVLGPAGLHCSVTHVSDRSASRSLEFLSRDSQERP